MELTKRDSSPPDEKGNHLMTEKSPYLLQHARNPVDWYPWGNEAFARAKEKDWPIFLSIGYSSCHWCHVMERESFEDVNVAKLLNENFVCIKVDREERPDIDQIYMKAVQAMNGSGGWPLNVFLTPNLEPFYGGTYFPPVSRYGVPGFVTLIKNISSAWRNDRDSLVTSASQIRDALSEGSRSVRSEIDQTIIHRCFIELTNYFDEEWGGFGRSPKFPTPSNLYFLLRYHLRTHTDTPLNMVTKTLTEMAKGGIFDQIGGGFHRYSTDRMWLVPHFEKMLYDNALLAIAYSEAFLINGDNGYERIVSETLDWVLSEMTSKETGAYYSAQDADSSAGEGEYYLWSPEQFKIALTRESMTDDSKSWNEREINAISLYFGVNSNGNFEGDRSILTARKDFKTISTECGLSEEEIALLISRAKSILLNERRIRPRPPTDDKILTGWNGMMISAMSCAYRVFKHERFLESAKRAAEFVLSRLSSEEESGIIILKRRYREGEVKDEGVLEDYAYFGNSLIDLYESTFDPKYLRLSKSICDSMISLFYDENNGGFFDTRTDVPNLILRTKEAYDGAMPSGNSIATIFSLRIGEITSDEKYKETAKSTFEYTWGSIESSPSSHTEMLVALNNYVGKPKEIVISGDLDQPETLAMIGELRSHFLPNAVVVHAIGGLETMFPIMEGKASELGQPPRVFVCSNFSCNSPSTNSVDLAVALES